MANGHRNPMQENVTQNLPLENHTIQSAAQHQSFQSKFLDISILYYEYDDEENFFNQK